MFYDKNSLVNQKSTNWEVFQLDYQLYLVKELKRVHRIYEEDVLEELSAEVLYRLEKELKKSEWEKLTDKFVSNVMKYTVYSHYWKVEKEIGRASKINNSTTLEDWEVVNVIENLEDLSDIWSFNLNINSLNMSLLLNLIEKKQSKLARDIFEKKANWFNYKEIGTELGYSENYINKIESKTKAYLNQHKEELFPNVRFNTTYNPNYRNSTVSLS